MEKLLENIYAIIAMSKIGKNYSKDVYDIERYDNIVSMLENCLDEISDTTTKDKISKLVSDEESYITPKIDVRGAIFQEDKILLVKEKEDSLWSLPGGWADINLSPMECIKKEIREEAGVEVEVKKLIAFVDKLKYPHPRRIPHIYKAFFLCEKLSGQFTVGLETEDIGFFKANDLPPLSLDRVVPEQIKLVFEHYYDNSLATLFN